MQSFFIDYLFVSIETVNHLPTGRQVIRDSWFVSVKKALQRAERIGHSADPQS
jgi:hypothetical protein